MKVFHNIFKHFSSNHQDKHSDKVNSHQHHGKVDKTHRAKKVEFDKLDNDSQIDNDFGLHIIYFLQHGCWNVTEHSPQIEKIWFYNSEPSIDIKEYNSFADNTTNTFIFTIIPAIPSISAPFKKDSLLLLLLLITWQLLQWQIESFI